MVELEPVALFSWKHAHLPWILQIQQSHKFHFRQMSIFYAPNHMIAINRFQSCPSSEIPPLQPLRMHFCNHFTHHAFSPFCPLGTNNACVLGNPPDHRPRPLLHRPGLPRAREYPKLPIFLAPLIAVLHQRSRLPARRFLSDRPKQRPAFGP